MWNKLKEIFTAEKEVEDITSDNAIATILVRAAKTDNEYTESEQTLIDNLLSNQLFPNCKKTNIKIPNKLVRPTSAIKREAIFSILESYSMKKSIDIYKNKSIIDIFAGSGLIGLEAISRGIKKSYFIENNENVCKMLKSNCDKICNINDYEIIYENAIIGIEKKFEIEPSIIFIDPPYNQEDINFILIKIIKNNIKNKDTVIIIETEKKHQIVIPKDLYVIKEKIFGKSKLLFLN